MVQCRRHNTQKFRTELKPAPVKKILLDCFFYLSYPLNPRHFHFVTSPLAIFILSTQTSDFCTCYVPTKEKTGIRTTRMKLSNTRKCFILSLFYIYFCTLVINTTDSTWLVIGNISTGCATIALYPCCSINAKSRAKDAGLQDT